MAAHGIPSRILKPRLFRTRKSPWRRPCSRGGTARPPEKEERAAGPRAAPRGARFPHRHEEGLAPETPVPSLLLSRRGCARQALSADPGGGDRAGTVISPGSEAGPRAQAPGL